MGYPKFICTSAILFGLLIPLWAQTNTYRGTLELRNWQAVASDSAPEIANLTMRWELADPSQSVLGTVRVQWYLGQMYRRGDEQFFLADYPEAKSLLSLKRLVLRAEVVSRNAENAVGLMRFDLGAPPPPGGIWGEAISVELPLNRSIYSAKTDSGRHYLDASAVASLFQKGFTLRNLQIEAVDFGGLAELDRAIATQRGEKAVALLLADGDRAYDYGAYQNALRFYGEAKALNPDAEGLQSRMDRARYRLLIAQGDSAAEVQNLGLARRKFEAARQLLPNEKLAGERLANLQQRLNREDAYQRIFEQLRRTYRADVERSQAKAIEALEEAAAAIDPSAEACRLQIYSYHRCREAYFQEKYDRAEREARAVVEQAGATISDDPGRCLSPGCDPYDPVPPDSQYAALDLLRAAKRKYAVYAQARYPAFQNQSRRLVERALRLDPGLGAAYFFRARFAADLIEKLNDLERAYAYDSTLTAAIEQRNLTRVRFWEELKRRTIAGDSAYFARAMARRLVPSDSTERLIEYALEYDHPRILDQLMLRAKGDAPTPEMQRLLAEAAQRGKPLTARYLVDLGADPALTHLDRPSALIIAIENERLAVLRELVQVASPQQLAIPAKTAVERGDLPALKLLLDSGADPNRRPGREDNLLMLAIRLEHFHMVDLLLDRKVEINHRNELGATALSYAAEAGRADIVTRLLENNAEVRPGFDYLALNDTEAQHFLARQVAAYAIAQNDVMRLRRAINVLPALGTEIHPQFDRPYLLVALAQNQDAMAAEMLTEAIDPDQSLAGEYVLLRALEREALATSEKLIKQLEASLAVRNAEAESPLHLVARSGNRKLFDLLMTRGHPVDVQNARLQTPLHLAIEAENDEIAAALIRVGADLSIADYHSWLPLHRATRAGKEDLVELMLSKGAEVNATGESGMTALHYAAERGDFRLANMLLEAGADPRLRDFFNRTPSKIARKNGDRELAKRLKG